MHRPNKIPLRPRLATLGRGRAGPLRTGNKEMGPVTGTRDALQRVRRAPTSPVTRVSPIAGERREVTGGAGTTLNARRLSLRVASRSNGGPDHLQDLLPDELFAREQFVTQRLDDVDVLREHLEDALFRRLQ